MAPRKRSVVWNFFRVKGEEGVECLLCTVYLIHKGHTTSMLRHLRIKHPAEFASAELVEMQESDTVEDQHIETDRDQYCSVEVALEDGDSDNNTTVNGAEITCALNEIIEAAEEVAGKQKKQKAANGDVRSSRKRSSIWIHFERLENQRCALCLICKKKIQHNSNTSNLHRHLSKKHPEAFSELGGTIKKPLSDTLQYSSSKVKACKPPETIVVEDNYPDVLQVTRMSEAEMRVLERERELIEALRSAQKEEARALEHQRELLEMLRAANAREAAADREKIEFLRKVQEEESRDLSRQREELQKERQDLQRQQKQLQREREEFSLLCRGQLAD